MVTISKGTLYPTEPLKTYDKAKELRARLFRDCVEAPKERGALVASGIDPSRWVLVNGIGLLGRDVICLSGEPYGAAVADNLEFSRQCHEACDAAGIPRDGLCSYARAHWGSILLNKYALADGAIAEPFPKLDFVFSEQGCCNNAKWFQRVSELLGGVPMIFYDDFETPMEEPTPARTKFRVAQYLDVIEQLEKVSGRKYNDELFVEGTNNWCRMRTLFAEACMETQHIPSPVNERRLWNFFTFRPMNVHTQEVVDLLREFRDELRDRAARGIAGVPTERFRYMGGNAPPPWNFLKFYAEIEKTYGAVSVGSNYTQQVGGGWYWDEEGHQLPAPLPEEIGFEISTANSREENMRRLIEYLDWQGPQVYLYRAKDKAKRILRGKKRTEDWKLDAEIAHDNKGCFSLSLCSPEKQRESREDIGLPRLEVQGTMTDPREFDFNREFARVEAFLESLGCKKITS